MGKFQYRVTGGSYMRMLSIFLAGVLALILGATAWARDEVELDEAEVFVEWNSTDTDFGIQFFWDSVGFTKIKVKNPDGKVVLDIKTKKNVKAQGLTEGFFESVEPPAAELSMAEFFARHPEGTYTFEGTSIDGDKLVGEAEFTHTLPAPPENLSPGEGALVDSTMPLVASLDPVTEDADGNPLTPELYQLILETENDILKVFTIILDGDVAMPQVTVPPEFLEPDLEYKFEVIVQEESGNRTIAETTFMTLP
jgi:hypothetical protein